MRKGFAPIIIISIIFLVLIVVGGFFLAKNIFTNKNKQTQTSTTQEVPKKWQFDEMTNKKETYIDKDFKLEIPSNWYITQSSETNVSFLNVSQKNVAGPFDAKKDKGTLCLGVFKEYSDVNFGEYLNIVKKHAIHSQGWSPVDTTIDSQKAVKVKTTTENWIYYVKHPTKSVFFGLMFACDFANYDSAQKQFLSSFKFLN